MQIDALSRNPVDSASNEPDKENIFVTQTRSKAGKLPTKNYKIRRDIKPNQFQNKQHNTAIEIQIQTSIDLKDDYNDPMFNEIAHENEFDHKSIELDELPIEGKSHKDNENITREIDDIIIQCKEQLFMRKNNHLYFVTTDGNLCDVEAALLKSRNELPQIEKTVVGDVKIINKKKQLHLAIVTTGGKSESTNEVLGNLTEALTK